MLYLEYPNNDNGFIFVIDKGDYFTSFLATVYLNIVADLFWLLPFTLMNMFIFFKLVTCRWSDDGFSLPDRLNSVIIKVFVAWCFIYLFTIGFGVFGEIKDIGSLLSGPYAPYGSFVLVYTVLGNFVYVQLLNLVLNKIN